MRKTTSYWPIIIVLVGGCTDAAPRPSFELLFPTVGGDLLTRSSPSLTDLTRDGVADIVFGTGVERLQPGQRQYVLPKDTASSGYVVAVSGTTGELIWSVPNPRDAFTTPRFAQLNGDGVLDVVMGGREGAFAAYDGINGALLWRITPAEVAKTPFPYNFFTPAVIPDVDGDGVSDFLVVYGGDDTRLPNTSRDPSYLAVISGAGGEVVKVHATPDGNESYSSIVVYERADGQTWFVFGTGGETHGGAAFRAPVASLVDGTFPTRVERLVTPGRAKGVIAPATLVELTGDAELDIVISSFDGRLIVVDGASARTLWQQQGAGEEAYHPAAVTRIARDGRLGLLVSRGIGAFPRYVGTVHRLYDAADGRLLYEYKDTFYPAGAPLAVDLTSDGIDEPFFFSSRYPSAQGGRIYILHGPSGTLITHDVDGNLASTPVIADPRGTGTLELIGLAWHIVETAAAPTWRDLRWQLLRMDLNTKTPSFRSWAGYMGTEFDGHYRSPSTVVLDRILRFPRDSALRAPWLARSRQAQYRNAGKIIPGRRSIAYQRRQSCPPAVVSSSPRPPLPQWSRRWAGQVCLSHRCSSRLPVPSSRRSGAMSDTSLCEAAPSAIS